MDEQKLVLMGKSPLAVWRYLYNILPLHPYSKQFDNGNKGIFRKSDAGTTTKIVKVVVCAIISEDV